MENQDIWDAQHERYNQSDWINKPSIFAEWVKDYLPVSGKILELGCGQGQDTRFFSALGYSVIALDFSEKGITYAREKTPENLNQKIEFSVADISQSLNFDDHLFDVVYSHLALHYFDEATTEKLFSEIHRVLKDGGILAFLVNSVNDPEYGTGEKIGDNYFKIRDIKKRFFDIESVKRFTKDFEIIELDDDGKTYKDRAIGTENLTRFIGRNKASFSRFSQS